MTPDQALALIRQSPQLQSLVRQRVLESGLTRAQIRQQLQAAGYPPDLLEAYISGEATEATLIDVQMLEAISLLGVNAFRGIESQRPDVGVQPGPDEAVTAAGPVPSKGELSLFGLDVFHQSSTRFQPVVAGPVDGSYPLGPGDVLVLILTGEVALTNVLEVTRQGFIVIPRVGQLYVNSLTLDQLRDMLYDRLGGVYSGVSRAPEAQTKFDVVVAKVRMQTIRVVGEVVRPGSYQVAATGGVLSALYEAGGLTERGNFRAVDVRRGTELVASIDLYDYLLRGIVPTAVRLEPGDVVFVPVHGPRVKIAGEVSRPAIYELKPGETLRDLIGISGDFTPYAATQTATIDRVLPPEQRPAPGHARTVLTVSLGTSEGSMTESISLLAADSVTVFAIRGGRRNAVTIGGSVWQPGTYQLAPGARLWDLIQAAGGLRPETYAGRVQVLRTFPDSSRQLFGYVLDIDNGQPDPSNNPMLEETDEVTIFAKTDFRPARQVRIHGAVNKPGTIAFADSMTLRDAILLAGGLRDDAYLAEAEVSRINENAGTSDDSLAVILQVPLDSSYVFDGTGYVRRPVGRNVAPQVPLNPYDNVFVRTQPGWSVQRNVTITGEVRFPGRYTLTAKGERLSSVLNRAGGLTPDAYGNGIQFYRAEGGVGTIAVNLGEVQRNPGHRDNLALAAGDSIHIPRYSPTVRVGGAVNFPTSVTYIPGAGLGYYVNAAGGYTSRADKGRAFVHQPNGLIEKGARPEPGAVVTVPQKDPSERSTLVEFLPFFTALVQVLAVAATLIIAINQ